MHAPQAMGGGLETQILSTGCRGRRKLTKQTNTQLVWWNRVIWEGKTSGPVTSAAPASGGAAVKLPEKLSAT